MSRRIRSPKPPVTGHPHADNDTRNAWDGETGGWVEIRQGEFMAAGEAYNDALDAASNTPGKE